MFSCEFCETFKNTFFYRTPQVAVSEKSQQFTMSVLKSPQKALAINYITYFPYFKKMHKYFAFYKNLDFLEFEMLLICF